MRKQLLFIALIGLCFTAQSQRQQYKKLKAGIHLGYAIPSDGGGGVALAFEPGYRINDELALQLRVESALTARDIEGESAKVAATGSYTINGQYYLLGSEKFRLFAGLGLGWFIPASVEIDGDPNVGGSASASIDPDGTFGFYPRVGFDFGHFNFTVDYNIVPASEETSLAVVNGIPVESDVELKNSYISVKIGATIGGGRK